MTREYRVQPLAKQHVAGFRQPVQQVGVGRVGPVTALVHLDDLVPGPESFGQLGRLAGGDGFGRQRVEAHARWQHQPFLRAADRHVHTPFIVAVVGRGQAGDGVDHQQRGVLRSVDDATHGGDIAGHAGRGFVVHHAHGLDLVLVVGCQALLDQIRLHAAPPAGRHGMFAAWQGEKFCLNPQPRGHLVPQRREVPGLVHHHPVAGAQDVGQRRLPRSGAGGRVDRHRMARLEDLLDVRQHLAAQRPELRTAVVDGGQAHGAQDAVGHGRRAGNLQKVASGRVKVQGQHAISLH